MKWIKKTYLRSIPLQFFGVCLSFYWFFWLYCITTVAPFIRRPMKGVKLFANKLRKRRNRGTKICWRLRPHANGRNIVGCYMLRSFAHPVACCCGLLGVVAQSEIGQTFSPVQNGSCCVRLHEALEMLTWKKSSQKVSSLREAQCSFENVFAIFLLWTSRSQATEQSRTKRSVWDLKNP